MDRNLLIGELQALIVETKRKYPEIKDATEKSLAILNGNSGINSVPGTSNIIDGPQSDDLLSPILLGCRTKVPKIIVISIGALQRLVSIDGLPSRNVSLALQTLNSVLNQGVDVQLRILQVVLSVLTHCKELHGEVLGEALLLCFKLQDSKTPVVTSTAAATLRQAVMLVFDRLRLPPSPAPTEDAPSSSKTQQVTLPDDTIHQLTLNQVDAYFILSDLCLLVGKSNIPSSGSASGISGFFGGGDKGKQKEAQPRILRLSGISRTFGLELIESVLSGFEDGVKQQPELLALIRRSLCPLLKAQLSPKSSFPITLRLVRLVYLLLRSFSLQLEAECEGFLITMTKLAAGEGVEMEKGAVPVWLRVLAMEILRGLCMDGDLLRHIYTHYDCVDGRVTVFQDLVFTMSHIAAEKPALLGVSRQMQGLGVSTGGFEGGKEKDYLDVGLSAMATAASLGVTTVSSMMIAESAGPGLGIESGLRIQCIEQHDKAEPPSLPETYLYLLALQTLDGIANAMHEIMSAPVDQTEIRDQASQRNALEGMINAVWPALLASYTFLLGTNLSDELFGETLHAIQSFTAGCGLLGFATPRDAFLNSLSRFAIPPSLVTAVQTYSEAPPTPRHTGVMNAESFGLSSIAGLGAAQQPMPSERNLAVLKVFIEIATLLLNKEDTAWHDILETLQNAHYILNASRPQLGRRSYANLPGMPTSGPTSSPMQQRTPSGISIGSQGGQASSIEQSLEVASARINELFENTSVMADPAFSAFTQALCQLSAEIIGLQEGSSDEKAKEIRNADGPALPITPVTEARTPPPVQRRRASGLHSSQTGKAGDTSFAIAMLARICHANLERLISREAPTWHRVTRHLTVVARRSAASQTIRIQAANVLGDLVASSSRISCSTEQGIPDSTFDVLAELASPQPVSDAPATDFEVRLLGIHSLNNLLEANGHALSGVWNSLFNILDTVCEQINTQSDAGAAASSSRIQFRSNAATKGQANLIRASFPALNLVCTDFLGSFSPEEMGRCISCLGGFGRQTADVNITLSTIGLIWTVSDSMQLSEKDGRSVELWTALLRELSGLCTDSRPEVRASGLQTLFRCIETHGRHISTPSWTAILQDIVFPILDRLWLASSEVETPSTPTSSYQSPTSPYSESLGLALQATGDLCQAFLVSHISKGPKSSDVVVRLLDLISAVFAQGDALCRNAGLVLVSRLTLMVAGQEAAAEALDLEHALWKFLDETWQTCDRADPSEHPLHQETLVALIQVVKSLNASTSDLKCYQANTVLSLLKFAMEYSHSPAYRPDIDELTPLQAIILEVMGSLELAACGATGSSLEDLSIYLSLAYTGSFDFVDKSMPVSQGKKPILKTVTYVAVTKKAMTLAVDMLQRHQSEDVVYSSGAAEKIIAALTLPIRLGADCPPANRFGTDPPLWSSAMQSLAIILGLGVPRWSLMSDLDETRHELFWQQVTEALQAMMGLSSGENGVEDSLRPDATQDRALSSLLSQTILPNLGYSSMSSYSITEISKLLYRSSKLFHFGKWNREQGDSGLEAIGDDNAVDEDDDPMGTLEEPIRYQREGLRLRCLGMLFDCVRESEGDDTLTKERKLRSSAIVLPLLLQRCRNALDLILLDTPIRGHIPFQRIRSVELVTILYELKGLRLLSGCWKGAVENGSSGLSKQHMISPLAHLFHLYPQLLALAGNAGRLPKACIIPSTPDGKPIQLDSRTIARECLEILGREMSA